MTLWFALAMMTAAAVFAVLWPLARRRLPEGGSDLAIYRDQLDEIARDHAAGLIGEAEAEAARTEVSRRLLAAADGAAHQHAAKDSAIWRRATALAALILLPIIAGAIYLKFGSPDLPAQPLAERRNAPAEDRSIESMVARIEAHLDLNPQDGRGWEVLAPVYARMGRVQDAVKARGNALRLLGENAERQADYGEALAAAANGIVTADARTAFERGLALDAGEPKSLYYLGLAAEQDGRNDEATRRWRDLLARAPADAPWRPLVEQSLARVTGTATGPSADDIAAAERLTPEQRTEMVRGMVARLAERLKSDGSDVDGWLRLVRAYMVLGDREQARAAVADARRALGSDGEKVQKLDALVKSLGLES